MFFRWLLVVVIMVIKFKFMGALHGKHLFLPLKALNYRPHKARKAAFYLRNFPFGRFRQTAFLRLVLAHSYTRNPAQITRYCCNSINICDKKYDDEKLRFDVFAHFGDLREIVKFIGEISSCFPFQFCHVCRLLNLESSEYDGSREEISHKLPRIMAPEALKWRSASPEQSEYFFCLRTVSPKKLRLNLKETLIDLVSIINPVLVPNRLENNKS